MLAKPKLIIAAALALTAGAGVAVGAAVQAHDSGGHAPPAPAKVAAEAPMDHAMEHMTEAVPVQPAADPGPGAAVFLAAELTGRAEVPAADGKKTGDPDGRAVEVIRIKGDKVSFAVAWKGIDAPTLSHIHQGAAGVNGAVKVPFFGSALPATVSAATGTVTVADPAVLDALVKDPGGFYANLHTAEFPGGAVRGQFKRLDQAVDLQRVLTFGSLASVGDSGQEVQAADGKKTGDPDGRAAAFVWAKGDRVDYSFSWSGVAAPTLGHLHQGQLGTNGPVVVPLFAAEAGLPESITGVAGTADDIDPKVVSGIVANPGDFYTNLHTGEFPGGAVRGQLFRSGAA